MEFRQTILPPPPTMLVALWRRAASALSRALDGVAIFVQRGRAPVDPEGPDLAEAWIARDSIGFPVEARQGAATLRDGFGAPGRWNDVRNRRTI